MINVFNTTFSTIRIGENLVQKIYIGDTLAYSVTATSSFDYVYYIMGLTYVSEIKNNIYGLHYDLLGGEL